MQIILTEQEYSNLKESADKAENYENLYHELMSQHLALNLLVIALQFDAVFVF